MIPYEEELKRLKKVYNNHLNGKGGKDIIADLESKFYVNEPAFVIGPDGKPDPIVAALRDGKRSVVMYIKDMLKKDKDNE